MYGITCANCFGQGCEACNNGSVPLKECSKEYERFPHQVVRALALAREGYFPEGGGTLDQTECFMQALAVWSDEQEKVQKSMRAREEKT